MQQRIINRVESDRHYRTYVDSNAPDPDNTPTDAIIVAARQISKTIGAKAMACFSLRGTTVLRASKKRPQVPILALCPFKETARQLVMSWGVYPDLPKAGSYGYDVSEENMFDYDKRELANMLVHFLWIGCWYLLTFELFLIISDGRKVFR